MDLRIPSADLDLRIEPLLSDQELDVSFRYWEGAVRAEGRSGHAVSARGYLELTGYGEAPHQAR
jgi:predicted secreted hydrolase